MIDVYVNVLHGEKCQTTFIFCLLIHHSVFLYFVNKIELLCTDPLACTVAIKMESLSILGALERGLDSWSGQHDI